MCPDEHNTEQRDEALRRRYNERQQAIQKARRRHAIIRLVLRVVVFLLVVSVSTSVTISTCSKKKASEANITQSEVENTSSEQEKKPQPKLPKSAADMVTPGDVNSHFVAILSLERGEIIASKSMHERIYPASLTKIMTLLVAFENNENLLTERIDHESILIEEKFPVDMNDNKVIITKDIFNDDALILSNYNSDVVTLKSNNHKRQIKFNFKSPLLGVWAKPGAPYVCIEPWWGVNDNYDKKDDLSQKRGIMALEPSKSETFSWSVEITE